MNATFKWKPGHGIGDIVQAIAKKYGVDVHRAAAFALFQSIGGDIEKYARVHAPWQDHTTNARQGLFAVPDIEKDRVILYLSHGVEYGVYLELCNQGRYAIIMPTLELHYPMVKKELRNMYGGRVR